jgi:hypothetical protein
MRILLGLTLASAVFFTAPNAAYADEKGIDTVVPKRNPAKTKPAIRPRVRRPARKSTSRGPKLTAEARRLYRVAEAARRSNAFYRHYGRWCRNRYWRIYGPGRMCANGRCKWAAYSVRSDHFILRGGRPGTPLSSLTRFHFRSANTIEQTGFRHICKTCRGWGNFSNRKLYWKRC